MNKRWIKTGLILMLCIQASVGSLSAQEKFDAIAYTAPRGWQKEVLPNAVQFSTEDRSDGSFAVMMLFKELPAGNDPRKNFDLSWESIVQGSFGRSLKAEMSPAGTDGSWTIQSGTATTEYKGYKAGLLLMSASGGGKVINLLVIMNSSKYQPNTDAFISSIVLPKIAASTAGRAQPRSPQPQTSKFKFSTTNFDNGWKATEEKDWVRVTKGNIVVLLHYPHPKEKETFFELESEARTFWDLLVAPRYSNLANFEVLRSDRDFEPARYAAGNVIENASGKKVFVALFSKLKRGWIEIIAPDKEAFIREFGRINVNDDIINWKPLLALFDYNKFGVNASDLQGKWATNFAGTTQYANIYTGRYVGAVTSVSAESYDFGNGSSYSWRVDGATSSLGRTNFSKAQSTGKFSLVNNWEIRFSDIEGRPQTYPVHFSIIRGGRVLWVNGNAFGRIN